jgi:hypothetical protein
MTPLLLSLALSAGSTAPVSVVVDSHRPGAESAADELVSLLYLALVDAGVPRDELLLEDRAESRTGTGGFARARQCEGRVLCLRSLAQLLGERAIVVGVDVGRVSDQLVGRVVAVRAVGEPVAELELSADFATWSASCNRALPAFARTLSAQREGAAVVNALAPAPAPEGVPVTVSAEPARPFAWKWPVAGAAALSFISAGVLLGAGLSGKAQYDRSLLYVDGLAASSLTAAQAHDLAARVNTELSVSLVAALVGAVLSGVAAWLFWRG